MNETKAEEVSSFMGTKFGTYFHHCCYSRFCERKLSIENVNKLGL